MVTKRLRRTGSVLAWMIVLALPVGSGCEFLGLGGGEVEQPDDGKADQADPNKQQNDTKPPPEPEALPDEDEAEEYERPDYPNMARRNPFQPDIEVVQPETNVSEGEDRTLAPLEQFAIGQLSLVAIISEVSVPKAMFIDPDGFGHVLKEGDRIGRSQGVVSDIRDNEVEVREGGGDDESQTRLRNIKLREIEIRGQRQDALTAEEREALEKLLESEEGREALQREMESQAPGANEADTTTSGQAPPQTDPRFRGVAPPTSEQ